MSTRRLKVILDKGISYDIRVGNRLLINIGIHLREATSATKAVIITDSNVGPRYLGKARAGLSKAGFEVFSITIPAGEENKSISTAVELYDELARLGIDGQSIIIGLGGGVVCDVAGFLASTYQSGIDYAQVPTSLYAMVDSSIGDKKTIHLPHGRDFIGSYKRPVYAAVDLATLSTLPANEWENGFSEIAKSALLSGPEFYQWILDNTDQLVSHNEAAVKQAIEQTLTFKAKAVADEGLKKGSQECLDYGYAFAHALEAVFNHEISHGKAITEGMRFAVRLGVEAAGVADEFVEEQDRLFNSLGFQPVSGLTTIDNLYERMFSAMLLRDGALRIVFVTKLGEWKAIEVDQDLLKIYLILWEQES